MLRNYLKIAYRNLVRHKIYSLINISGLAIGTAFCILTFLYVHHEWTYDAFHENADRIYRVYRDTGVYRDFGFGPSSTTPDALGPALAEAFPEVRSVRIEWGASSVMQGDRSFQGIFRFVDPAILEVFTFPLVKGDPATVLEDPYSVVITEAAARKYFGDEDPLDKVLSVEIEIPGRPPVVRDFVVTGIAESVPKNSSIRFDFLAPFEARGELRGWGMSVLETYVLLPEHRHAADLEKRFPELVKMWLGEKQDDRMGLQPLLEVHLNPGTRGPKPVSNPAYSYILLGIALLVLMIACVNFMTLAVGLSFARAREVGMRKVVGASRTQLMLQLLGESMLLSAMALVAGVALTELLLPAFNSLAGQDLALDDQADGVGLVFLLGLALAVGLAAGSYPAFVLSGFQPVAVLKRRLSFGGSGLFGRALVVFQLALSVFLVVSALLMARQLTFLRTKPLGFESDHVLRIGILDLWERDSDLPGVYRNELLRHHAVLGVTETSHMLSNRSRSMFSIEHEGNEMRVDYIDVDYDFLKTMGISLLEGADFDTRNTNSRAFIIVNEALVRRLGWEAPVAGRVLRVNKWDITVIGVVQDFHFRSLHHRIGPVVLKLSPRALGLRVSSRALGLRVSSRALGWLLIRVRPENIPGTLAFLEEKWQEVAPDLPFRYSFLGEEVDRQYRKEERWSRIVQYSALFAVFIACLGAFGLTALAVARRTKEIGIRKALGATVPNILSLLSREFLVLVAVASVIACPVAYYAMERWLQDFAYRIDPGVGTFVLGGVLMLAVVLLAVGSQAMRAARANPVDALRYE